MWLLVLLRRVQLPEAGGPGLSVNNGSAAGALNASVHVDNGPGELAWAIPGNGRTAAYKEQKVVQRSHRTDEHVITRQDPLTMSTQAGGRRSEPGWLSGLRHFLLSLKSRG